MAYDSALPAEAEPRNEFYHSERIVVLLGGAALGLFAGCFAALALGRTDLEFVYKAAAPVFVVAFYLAYATLRDASERKGAGCKAAAAAAVLSLVAWPLIALVVPPSTLWFWIAPALMSASLLLLALCWSGSQSAIYRTIGEAASLCMIAGFLGLSQLMA